MLKIGEKTIGEGYPVYLIAEIGINHNGDPDLAVKMVEEAAKCGADAVKFQIVDAEKSYTKTSESYAVFKKVELAPEVWQKVVKAANAGKVDIFASFAHPSDIPFIKELGLPAIKISSGNLTNYPLLKASAISKLPIIISTGMSYLQEVQEVVQYLERQGARQLVILQCTSLYPVSPADVNLRAIETFRRAFPYPVGFSDHTLGNHCALAAVALGACIIEKHFTLDRVMVGPDHHFSATPQELSELVSEIRAVEAALGSTEKKPAPAELPLRDKYRRSIVAARDIAVGEVLTEAHFAIKRASPAGLESKYLDSVVGRTVRADVKKDTPITAEILL